MSHRWDQETAPCAYGFFGSYQRAISSSQPSVELQLWQQQSHIPFHASHLHPSSQLEGFYGNASSCSNQPLGASMQHNPSNLGHFQLDNYQDTTETNLHSRYYQSNMLAHSPITNNTAVAYHYNRGAIYNVNNGVDNGTYHVNKNVNTSGYQVGNNIPNNFNTRLDQNTTSDPSHKHR